MQSLSPQVEMSRPLLPDNGLQRRATRPVQIAEGKPNVSRSTVIKILGGAGLAVAVTLGATACGSSNTHHPSAASCASSSSANPSCHDTESPQQLASESEHGTPASAKAPAIDNTAVTPQLLEAAAVASGDVAQDQLSSVTVDKYMVSSDGKYAIALMDFTGSLAGDTADAYFVKNMDGWKMTTMGTAEITPQLAQMPADVFNTLTNSLANVHTPAAQQPAPQPQYVPAPQQPQYAPAPQAPQTPSYSYSSGIQPNGGSGDTGAASDDPTDNGPSYSPAPSYSNEGAPSYSSGGIQSNGGSGDTGAAGDDPTDNG